MWPLPTTMLYLRYIPKVLTKKQAFLSPFLQNWLRELDLNQRPSGYEPDELPSCSIPRHKQVLQLGILIIFPKISFVNIFFWFFLFFLVKIYWTYYTQNWNTKNNLCCNFVSCFMFKICSNYISCKNKSSSYKVKYCRNSMSACNNTWNWTS